MLIPTTIDTVAAFEQVGKTQCPVASIGTHSRDLLKMVTIVIPTVSRPHCVHRQFRYWDKSGATVLILDGAAKPIDLNDDERNSTNVKYLHTGARFNNRLASAGSLIQTPYAALLPDDEFFLKDGLNEALSFLENNPSSIGCAGKVLGFFVDQDRFLTFQMYSDWKEFPEDCDNAAKRLDFALPPGKAHKVQFHLLRSDIWKKLFYESYCDFYSSGYVYERIINLFAAQLGRTDLIDVVVWMRSLEHAPLSTENVPRTGDRNFVSWATSDEYAEEVQHLRRKVEELLRREPSLTENQIEEYQRRFVDGGIRRQLVKERNPRRRAVRWARSLLVRYSPRRLRRFAKRNVPSQLLRFSGWQGESIEQTIRRLTTDGIAVSRQCLLEVASLALETSKEIRMPTVPDKHC